MMQVYEPIVCINIVKMFVAIILLSKELMALLRNVKCNFIE